MRICIDLDGTLCKTKRSDEEYINVEPTPGAVEAVKKLKSEGHYLILMTARHMKTCNGSVGQVVARQGKTLFDWLDKYELKFDEVWFGKPFADVYIDDNVLAFKNNWTQLLDQIKSGNVGLKMNKTEE